MAFADDLLKDARLFARLGGKRPRTSTLRRSVSTSYYAVFHLLIADFTANWKFKDQRARLGRMFDHKRMVDASFNTKHNVKETAVDKDLKKVIAAFKKLQDDRHNADYDVEWNCTRVEAELSLQYADQAFEIWPRIRKEKASRDHLLTMFGARRVS